MKVHIVCGDIENNWILGKFADKLKEYLTQLGVYCDISSVPDYSADINHAVIYFYAPDVPQGIFTMMITHVDELHKLDIIRKKLEKNNMGICMSNDTMLWLAKLGLDKKKLCYVNPAHDGCALIKKYVIGIASRVYPDGRKNELYFDNLASDLDPNYFHFKFMGAGWENQVDNLRNRGFEVTYYDRFIRREYYSFIQSLDYYLYTGSDEGQMGFVDAAAAGVKTIVTPQGYHLDAPDALSYSFQTYDELKAILLQLQEERKKIISSVEDWTWMAFAKKHIEIWKYLMGESTDANYSDGLNSYYHLCNEDIMVEDRFIKEEESRLKVIESQHRQSYSQNTSSHGLIREIKKRIRFYLNKQALK